MGTAPEDRAPHSGWYLIRIKGRLPSRWAAHFEPMTLTDPGDDSTVLEGPVTDQAALHGLLVRVRDTGLPLISVTQPDPTIHTPQQDAPQERETVMTTNVRTSATDRSQRAT